MVPSRLTAPAQPGAKRLLRDGLSPPLSKAPLPSLGNLRMRSSSPEMAKREENTHEFTADAITTSPPGGTTVAAPALP